MTDRDALAAAALTGLIANEGEGPSLSATCRYAYCIADAMLAARTPPAKPSGVAEAYATAQQISDAQDFVRYCEEFEAWKKSSRNAASAKTANKEPLRGAPDSGKWNEPAAAWSYRRPDQSEYGPMFTDDQDIADAAAARGEIVVPLYRHLPPTLTDEERQAVKLAADFLEDEFYGCSDKCAAEHNAVATLRKLLERMA